MIDVQEFAAALERVLPQAGAVLRAEGPHLPIAFDLDDSALRHDLGDVPSTPLEEGILETAAIFERLNQAGTLDTQDLDA